MIFIDKIRVYAPANAKCKEFGSWVADRFSKCLTDELTMNCIYDEIREMMATLDEKYPRTKPLRMEVSPLKDNCHVMVSQKGKVPDTVCVITWTKIEAKYMLSAVTNRPVYYSRKEEEKYRQASMRQKGGKA